MSERVGPDPAGREPAQIQRWHVYDDADQLVRQIERIVVVDQHRVHGVVEVIGDLLEWDLTPVVEFDAPVDVNSAPEGCGGTPGKSLDLTPVELLGAAGHGDESGGPRGRNRE